MPIKGLTDAPRAFIRVGRIKKGSRDPETGKMTDLDYFRTVFDPSAKNIEEEFKKVYGEKPVRINIRLAFRTIPEVWDANYECYKKGGLIAKAGENDNGLYWIYYRDPDTSEVLVRDGRAVGSDGQKFMANPIDLKKPIYSYVGNVKQPDDSYKKESIPVYLEPAGRLNVVVPEIAHLRVGFMEFCPGSPRDIRTISAELAGIQLWADNTGRELPGIPMVLTRRQEDVTVNINGTLSRKKSWVVHIELAGEWGGKALESLEMRALPDNIVDGEVIEGDFEDEEPKQITDEWEPPAEFSNEEPRKTAPKPRAEKSEPVQSPVSTGEVQLTRPYSALVFRAKLLEMISALPAVYEEKKLPLTSGPNDGKILASILDQIFNGDKGVSRHIVCAWLLEKTSTKAMTAAELKALFHIMGIKGEPRYESVPSAESIEEFRAVYAQAVAEGKPVQA